MYSVLNSAQHAALFMPLIIDGSSGTPTVTEGTGLISIVDSGVGIYTVTFNNPFARKPVITASCEAATGVTLVPIVRNVTQTGFIVEITDDASTLVDGIVHLHVWGSNSADQGGAH